MRLLDRILAYGLHEDARIHNANVIQNLLNSQLVVIDNVADYFFTQRFGDFFTVSDFPCVMLPFELSFFEFRFPPQGKVFKGCDEVGVGLMMQEPDDLRAGYPELFNLPGVKYCLFSYYFVRRPGSNKMDLIAETRMPVGISGQIISPANDRIYAVTRLFTLDLSADEEKIALNFIHEIVGFPVFLALSFMHCRNVKMKEESPPPKLSKSHQKKRGRPLLRYHILEIDHMKSVLEREGSVSTGGLKKALHICRGHFATYGQNGKGLLFGKLSGRYWIPMHKRGSAKEGVVVKDYNVK